MAIPSETRTLNSLLSYTADIYAPDAVKNMLTSNPLVDRMARAGNARVVEGGARIDVIVQFGYNPGAQWYQGADVLDMTPYEIATTAKYDWKQLHAPVTYTGEEERKNRGASRIRDMVAEKISTTEETLWKVLEIAMMGDGTAAGGKSILGLEAMFPVTATTDPTIGAIGGITAVANPWWQNYAVSSFGSFAANGPAGTAADAWLDAWNVITDGTDHPNLIISARDVWQFYHKNAMNQIQIIMSDNARANLKFASIAYNGAEWFWSRVIADGRAYFLRTGDLKFYVQRDANMQLSEWVKSWNQDMWGASMHVMCAFFPIRRIFGAVIDGITA